LDVSNEVPDVNKVRRFRRFKILESRNAPGEKRNIRIYVYSLPTAGKHDR